MICRKGLQKGMLLDVHIDGPSLCRAMLADIIDFCEPLSKLLFHIIPVPKRTPI